MSASTPSASPPPTPRRAAGELIPILHASHQVVLYNPTSHAVTIHDRATSLEHRGKPLFCPYCDRPFDSELDGNDMHDFTGQRIRTTGGRAHNYFQLLEVANETSRPGTPLGSTPPPSVGTGGAEIAAGRMAEGYFESFFREEHRLGMGAYGSVFLCQHVLDGNSLGRFAVKKIAVGQSHDYLVNALREVRLLETLHHPNIITYHHAWLETCRFSSFGLPIPTLFVLMQWAEGGSLDDFIRARLGAPCRNASPPSGSPSGDEPQSRSARIRAFRAARARPEVIRARNRERRGRAVHFLSPGEVKSIFNNVVEGLGFLHSKSILHLDLKPGNVLLTWDDGSLIPRAMLSDFGTYQDMIRPERSRTGVTGTLEYTAPESLSITTQPSSKADMWSLGMILHILLFLKLPYDYVEDSDISKLEAEVRNYAGFKSGVEVIGMCKRRGFPRAALILLGELLTVNPWSRPSCEQILVALKAGKLDPLNHDTSPDGDFRTSLVPVSPRHTRRRPSDAAQDLPILDSNGSGTTLLSSAQEKTPTMLSLPSPTAPGPQNVGSKIWAWVRSAVAGDAGVYGQNGNPRPGKIFRIGIVQIGVIPLFKSGLLVAKVMSLHALCRMAPARPIILCGVLVLAVLDVWLPNNLVLCTVLGTAHLGIIGMGRRTCCMY